MLQNFVQKFQKAEAKYFPLMLTNRLQYVFFITLNLVTTSEWELSYRINSVSYILGSGLSENSSRFCINAIFRLFPHSLGSYAVSISKGSLSGSLISNLGGWKCILFLKTNPTWPVFGNFGKKVGIVFKGGNCSKGGYYSIKDKIV